MNFLVGGNLVDLMVFAAECRSKEELLNVFTRGSGPERSRAISKMNEKLKGIKVRSHLGRWRKVHRIVEDDASYEFSEGKDDRGPKTTVKAYYEKTYASKLHNGRLRYPQLPLVSLSLKRPDYTPAEVLEVSKRRSSPFPPSSLPPFLLSRL